MMWFENTYMKMNSKKVGGNPPHYPKNWLVLPPCPPTVLTQKCRFCHFHAVFDYLVQIVPPPVDPIWETLLIANNQEIEDQIENKVGRAIYNITEISETLYYSNH